MERKNKANGLDFSSRFFCNFTLQNEEKKSCMRKIFSYDISRIWFKHKSFFKFKLSTLTIIRRNLYMSYSQSKWRNHNKKKYSLRSHYIFTSYDHCKFFLNFFEAPTTFIESYSSDMKISKENKEHLDLYIIGIWKKRLTVKLCSGFPPYKSSWVDC